ncbi:hypothetical protein ACRALDRAFT_207525 [Sodiomyces alcalophilus JCM 7366]|uniref:uncharacterized protein n=1 Tax=Sodiomyces alcalophilus JCM 7366 TaxID=591952 RepID=UPI0039B54483
MPPLLVRLRSSFLLLALPRTSVHHGFSFNASIPRRDVREQEYHNDPGSNTAEKAKRFYLSRTDPRKGAGTTGFSSRWPIRYNYNVHIVSETTLSKVGHIILNFVGLCLLPSFPTGRHTYNRAYAIILFVPKKVAQTEDPRNSCFLQGIETNRTSGMRRGPYDWDHMYGTPVSEYLISTLRTGERRSIYCNRMAASPRHDSE